MHKGIAYQNKDIMSKYFALGLAGKSLEVYGVRAPRISRFLNVDFPVVMANELFADNLYLMEDYSICIVDYESRYRWTNKIKYARYITQVLTRYEKLKIDTEKMPVDVANALKNLQEAWKGKIPTRIRVIVIYTGDVRRGHTNPVLDVGSMRINIQEAFLSEIDTPAIKRKLYEKIACKEKLTEEELMEFVILPLSVKGSEEKQKLAEEMLELTDDMDEAQARFLLSGMAVAGDKFLTEETRNRIRRRLEMTKIGMMFEKEKEEAVKAKEKQMNLEIMKRDRELEKREQELEKKDEIIKAMMDKINRLEEKAAML